MLRCAVEDPPWNTGMARGDAARYLEGGDEDRLNQIVSAVLTELLEDGLVYFYRAKNLNDPWDHPRTEADAMPREEVVAELAKGTIVDEAAGITGRGDLLWFEATERGKELYRRGSGTT